MQLKFLGATETVTGSKFLITCENKRYLVDCGLFQGYKELRLRNWAALPIKPRSIDAVFLTHAHIDHSGYIPRLVKDGFTGQIYSSHATRDLCQILLPDSGYLQEEEARFANKHGYSKHKPALPLYTKAEALAALHYFNPQLFGRAIKIGPLTVQFNRAGHILGAATVLVKYKDQTLFFSGDLGRPNDPIMCPPTQITDADYVVMESTYGDRQHEQEDTGELIKQVVKRTAARGGTIVVPAFAVGRAQTVLYYLYKLFSANEIPKLPVYLDSPMAISATELFVEYHKEHHLTEAQCHDMCDSVIYTRTVEESKAINANRMPKVIVSASGMATGGRVLHHIRNYAPDSRNTILFTGYQAGGTRGDRMVKGEREVKMLGDMVPIRAEIVNLQNMSAHADMDEIMAWLGHFHKAPRKVFLTHGEKTASTNLQSRIINELGWQCEIAKYCQEETLG